MADLTNIVSIPSISARRFESLTREMIGLVGFIFLIITTAAIIYFDDIQITQYTSQETSTIYNMRIGGLKIVDLMSAALFFVMGAYVFVKGTFEISIFHRTFFIIIGLYCYAAVVGFIYSFSLRYDYAIWVQDLQQVVYYAGFFFITFYFLDTKKKWNVFVILFILFMALKNLLITYKTFMGEGKIFGDWAIRASQNSEFTYFPMMFFTLFAVFLYQKNKLLRAAIAIVVFLYLFNSLIGIARTVWVMLILGTMYLFYHLDSRMRKKTFVVLAVFVTTALLIIASIFPRFLDLAWNYKFASIFEWKVYGDRSNATRVIEIINVFDYIFRHYAFLQGMGLGAFWDDAARRLLPDGGSGFLFKTRFNTTHMLMLTQFLKLGFVATFIYWAAIGRLFLFIMKKVKSVPRERWEKNLLIGLHVGFLCGYLSNADFVRMFLVLGINLGITAAYFSLEERNSAQTVAAL